MGTKALVTVLVCVSVAAAQRPGPAQREAQRLEGIWVVVRDPKAAVVLGDRWIIKAGQITFDHDLKQKKEERVWRYFRVDPTRNPRTIEIAVFANEQGGEALFIQYGVYTLEGDQLQLYLADFQEKPPVRFPRQPKLTRSVLTLKRVQQ